ncbi:hypothetical protein CU097_006020 [Rhizopus azygosporus]|uniref:Uncharacterized protein n=1 Tax=Rhizopus azygosporus TaxID=86630 RepID=A0A367JXZ4_RHIAZ|nr:hypothetical protein CU097_006020 [Rhizopus azygosporus]
MFQALGWLKNGFLQVDQPAKRLELLNNQMLSEKRRSIVQQLSVNKNKGTIWESEIFSSVNRYHLRELVRQQGYTTPELVRKAYEKDHEKFPGETYVIYADGNYIGTKGIASAAQKENRLTQTLHLKIALTGYIDEENICLKKFRNDRQVSSTSYTRTKFPVVPAFASAIHKAQSTAIDCVDIHLLYVAMSRVRRADNLCFFGADLPISIKRKYCVDCDAVELVKQKTHIDHRS